MNTKAKKSGFSLAEVMMAVGILGVGMLFVAGTFPVAIHFNTVATERTTAAIVADEAFAKIRLYGIWSFASPPWPANPYVECADFNDLWYQSGVRQIIPAEFAYPSTDMLLMDKQYFWSALCRRVGLSNVQVTVFISRKSNVGATFRRRRFYPNLFYPAVPNQDFEVTEVAYPVPVWVEVDVTAGNNNEIRIVDRNGMVDQIDETTFIGEGGTLVDNKTGRLYRVLERYPPPEKDLVLLDRPWWNSGVGGFDAVWVIPPPAAGVQRRPAGAEHV